MNNKYIVGVDCGSQSTKVYIYDQEGNVVCGASEPLKPMMTRQHGYVEHPDDDLWDCLKVSLNKLMKEFKGDPNDIVGLGICSIRCCRVFLKEDGSLAEPIMSWMDVRAYETFIDDENIRYTGSTSGYLTFRLTGEFKDTVANAYQWQFPTDMNTWEWSTDEGYFSSFKIPKEKLFELHLPGTILGHVHEQASLDTGLPVGLPIVATANDKAVEALGCGLIEENVGLISLGTYITSMVFGEKNIETANNFFTNLSNLPFQYLYESAGIRRGMWHITWFKNIMGEEYAKKAFSESYSVEDFLAKEAQALTPGSDGLMTIPDWLSPANQLYRKGVILGFDERHTRGHIYRSLLEGIALTLKNNYDAMCNELGIHPNKIIVSGGGSNSDLYMQIISDIYGVPTVRNVVNGAASLGAAISVAVAKGVYPDYETAVKHMVKQRDEFIPNFENHKSYTKFNEAYRQLPSLLESALKTVHDTLK